MSNKKLVIHAIDCKVHSTGVDAEVLNSLSNVVSAAADVGKASAPFTGPVGAAVTAALGAAGLLIGGVVDLAVAIDKADDEPDQLYLNFSNNERQNKIWPQQRSYYEIRSGQIVRPNLIIPFSNAVDVNFWEYDTGSDDDYLGRLTVDTTHTGGVRYQVVTRPLEGSIYVVAYSVEDIPFQSISGALLWNKHNGWQDGTLAWQGFLQVGTGWAGFRSVFATSDGVLYAIQNDGKLMWYRQPYYQNGSGGFRGPLQVGEGWQRFKSVFDTSNGVLYAIQHDGTLWWLKHNGWLDGTGRWADPIGGRKIGEGWQRFKSVFATSDGVIYAIQYDGTLWWLKHNGWQDSTGRWADPIGGKQVGIGWGSFKSVFATRNGIIYAIQNDGSLLWYYHQGWQNGHVSWAGPAYVSQGWQKYKSVFATTNGILYGINP